MLNNKHLKTNLLLQPNFPTFRSCANNKLRILIVIALLQKNMDFLITLSQPMNIYDAAMTELQHRSSFSVKLLSQSKQLTDAIVTLCKIS